MSSFWFPVLGLGLERLHESVQKSADLSRDLHELTFVFRGDIAQISRNQDLSFHLNEGASCLSEKMSKILFRDPSLAFGNIACD